MGDLRRLSCAARRPALSTALFACCLLVACYCRCQCPSTFATQLRSPAVPAELSLSSSPARAPRPLPSASQQKQQPDGRRHLAVLLALSAIALVAAPAEPSLAAGAAARPAPKSKFTGKYTATSEALETNFISCPRQIFVAFDGTKGKIKGDDPILPQPDAPRNCGIMPVKTWTLSFTISGEDEIVIEEGSESITTRQPTAGEPKKVVATWDGSGLVFPDGTKWTKK